MCRLRQMAGFPPPSTQGASRAPPDRGLPTATLAGPLREDARDTLWPRPNNSNGDLTWAAACETAHTRGPRAADRGAPPRGRVVLATVVWRQCFSLAIQGPCHGIDGVAPAATGVRRAWIFSSSALP